MQSHLRRPLLMVSAFLAALTISACAVGGTEADGGGDAQQADILMNWFAQAEQGGYWQAQAAGIYEEHGVQARVRQGGPQIQTIPQVASGEAEFGVAQADELILARAEGVPVVQVFGGMDTYLQCMMFHSSAGIEEWDDLSGHRVAVAPSGGFWPYIKGKYGLDVQEINFTGSMSTFANDEDMVQQCFITSEPYVAKEENIDIETMMVASAGYNPYSQGLFTTEQVINENPDLVRSVVAAAQEGWESFLSDPSAGKQLILKTNADMTPDAIDYAHDELANGDYFTDPAGTMTAERWNTLASQMREAGVLTNDVDVSEVWTNEFLP